MTVENDKLFENILKSELSDGVVELLFQEGSCPEIDRDKRGIEVKEKNFDIFLSYIKKENIFPEIIINFGDKKPKKKWLKKIEDEGLRATIKSQGKEIRLAENKEIKTISLDFNRSGSELKKSFLKEYEKSGQRILLVTKKKKNYDKKEFSNLNYFIQFIVGLAYEESGKNKKEYRKILEEKEGFHFFPGFRKGCIANKRTFINLKDLSVVFCPNCSEDVYSFGKIGKESLEGVNNPLFIAIKRSSLKEMPVCETCLINEFCDFDCFLSQKEKSGDLLTPHPEFCRFSHKKVLFFLKKQNELNLNNDKEKVLLNKINEIIR